MTWTPNEVVHLKANVLEETPEGVVFYIDGAISDVIIRHPNLASEHSPVVAKIGRPITVGDRVTITSGGASGTVLAIAKQRAWVSWGEEATSVLRLSSLKLVA